MKKLYRILCSNKFEIQMLKDITCHIEGNGVTRSVCRRRVSPEHHPCHLSPRFYQGERSPGQVVDPWEISHSQLTLPPTVVRNDRIILVSFPAIARNDSYSSFCKGLKAQKLT